MQNFGVHLILGLGVVGGVLSAMLFRRFSAPQVMGYIAAGVLLGRTGFHVVGADDIVRLSSFNMFTLGLIGFLVGSEIKFATVRQYARQFTAILLAEGVLSFGLVGCGAGLIVYFVSHSLPAAVAAGVVLGAVASATDPASTISVLWEYRSAGVLTTTLTAIVALDDALAMTLYGLGTGFAQILTGGTVSMAAEMLRVFWEIGGAVLLGVAGGLLGTLILRRSQNQESVMTAAVGLLLLCIGVSVLERLDTILAAMSFGITLVNMTPQRSRPYVDLIRRISPPFYVMFFVLVGARLHFAAMPPWMWLLVAAYVILRSTGKIVGAWMGARAMRADTVVQQYCGMGLLAQGGVAIGLSVMAGQRLGNVRATDDLLLADLLVFAITATTFVVQMIGPPLVKIAVRRAGEAGRDVTESDVMNDMQVADVLQVDVPSVRPQSTLQEVVDAYTKGRVGFVPVVDTSGRLHGIVGPEQLRGILLEQSVWAWLLAADVAAPPPEQLSGDTPLVDALNVLDLLGVEQLPSVNKDTGAFEGALDRASSRHAVRLALVDRQARKGRATRSIPAVGAASPNENS